MAEDNLEIVILAKDKASSTLKSVGNTMKGAFKFGAIAATGGLVALTAGLGTLIAQGMEGERVQAALNAVLTSTGGVAGLTADELNTMSDSLSRATPFAQDMITEAQTLLLTFTNIGEDVFPMATETVLNMATVFGSTDAAAIQLGKALNDPVKGIGALSEVGVSFTEEQKKLVQQLVNTGDMAGAQGVILAELEKEFGGAARAAGDTFGGKLTILKNKLLDVVETVGMQLIPFLSGITDTLIKSVIPAFEKMGPKIKMFFLPLFAGFASFSEILSAGGSLRQALAQFFIVFEDGSSRISSMLMTLGVAEGTAKKIAGAFDTVWNVLSGLIFDTIVPFIKEHSKAFKNALIAIGVVVGGAMVIGGILSLGATIAALVNPITLVIGAIALLAMAWTEDWGGIRTYVVNELWPALQPVLEALRQWIAEQIPVAMEYLRGLWENTFLPALAQLGVFWNDTLKPALIELGEWLSVAIPDAVQILSDLWNNVLVPAFEALANFWNNTLKPAFTEIWNWLSTAIPDAVGFARAAWEDVLKPALAKISDFWTNTLQPIASDIVAWVKTAIPDGVELARAAWENVLKPAMEKISTFWTESLQPAFDEIKTWLMTTIPLAMLFIKAAWEDVLKPAMEKVHTFWVDTLQPTFDVIKTWLMTTIPLVMVYAKNAWTGFKNKMTDVHNFWERTLKPTFEVVQTWLETTIPAVMISAKNAWIGFKNKMTDVHNFWVLTLKPTFDKIIELLEGAFKTAVDTAKGVMEDLEGAFDSVWGAVDDLIDIVGDLIGKLADLIIPDFLKEHSPSPFEQSLRNSISAMQALNSELSLMDSNMNINAGGFIAGMNQGAAVVNNNQQYNLNMKSNARQENLRADFNMMRTWGGLR